MHVVMTYPGHMSLRGGDWAAAARRGGIDVTEIVLVTALDTPALPTVPWLAQSATNRYLLQIPAARKAKKVQRRLAMRVAEAVKIVAGHHGAVDVLHTNAADHSLFAAAVSEEHGLAHVHNEPHMRDADTETLATVLEAADAIRTWTGHPSDQTLPDAYRDRLVAVPTPIDSSIEGAEPQFAAVAVAGTAVTAPGQPWLAALSPRKIVWRGDLTSHAAAQMVDTFAILRLTGTQLEMVGDGAADSHLRSIAEQLGLDGRVVLRECGSPRETARLISEADLVIIGDADPLLEREAMTALLLGTPVIAPDTDVYSELMCEDLGALVAQGDSQAMVCAVRKVTMVDVHDAVSMAARAGRHTLAAVGAALANLYHFLVHGEAQRRTEPTLHEAGDDRQIAS